MEEWRVIEGYEQYLISNLGDVKSTRFSKEKILKKCLSSNGYYSVNLYNDYGPKNFLIHHLVAIAFLNHKPNGFKFVIDHKDNDKLNNNVDNLQIVTLRYNICKTNRTYSSKYSGVYWSKRYNRWIARILINGKRVCLGYFKSEDDAGNAYLEKLKLITEGNRNL